MRRVSRRTEVPARSAANELRAESRRVVDDCVVVSRTKFVQQFVLTVVDVRSREKSSKQRCCKSHDIVRFAWLACGRFGIMFGKQLKHDIVKAGRPVPVVR